MANRNKILIIGTGRMGAEIANRASARGENVVVIDKDEVALGRLDDTFAGFKVVGDATDDLLLTEDCYVDSCFEVVITTGDDNANLLLAHLCSEIHSVPHVYVRLDNSDKAILIGNNPRIKAIYPSELSLDRFIALEAEGEKQ